MKTLIVFECGGNIEVYFYQSYFIMLFAAQKELDKGNRVVIRE